MLGEVILAEVNFIVVFVVVYMLLFAAGFSVARSHNHRQIHANN